MNRADQSSKPANREGSGPDVLDLPQTPSWRRFIPRWARALVWVDSRTHYDAFLSYSWSVDSEIAPVLQSLLQGFLRPWYNIRAKNVFRDLSCLPAGSSLEAELCARLDQSDHLIVLACPEAATSRGMELEASYWFSKRRAGHVLIVVTGGDFRAWEEIRGALLPPSLRANLVKEPLFVLLQDRRRSILTDSRRAREELIEDLKQVILRLHPGRSWGELRGEERRNRRHAIGLVSAAMATLLALTVWARTAQHQAERAALLTQLELSALATRDRLDSGSQAEALDDATNDVAVAIEKLGEVPFTTATSLRNAVERSREISRWAAPGQVQNIALGGGGSEIVVVTRNGGVSRWSWRGTLIGDWQAGAEQFEASLTPSGSGVLVRHQMSDSSDRGTLRLATVNGTTLWTKVAGTTDGAVDTTADGATTAISVDGASVSIQRRNVGPAVTIGRRSVVGPIGIAHMQLSSDGKRLLVAYADGVTRIIDTVRATTAAHWRGVQGASIFADGTLSHVAELADGTLVVRHSPQFAPQSVRPFERGQSVLSSAIESVAVASNGRMAVTFQNDARIELLEPDGSATVLPLRGGHAPRVAWSVDGTRLVAGDYLDLTMRVYDLTASTARHLVPPRPGRATAAITICEHAGAVLFGDMEGFIRAVWPTSGELFEYGRVHDYVEGIVCLADGGFVSVGRQGRILFHPQPRSAETIPLTLDLPARNSTADLNEEHPFTVAAADDGLSTVGATYQGHVLRWRPRSGPEPELIVDLPALTHGAVNSIRALAALPGASEVVVAGEGRDTSYVALVALGERPAIRWIKNLPSIAVVMSLAVEEQSRNILVAGTFDRLVVLNHAGIQQLDLIGVQRPLIRGLTSLGRDLFAAASLWGGLSFWRTTGEKLPPNYDAWVLRGPVQLAFSRSHQRLYAAGADGAVVEIIVGVPELVTKACERLTSRGAPNSSQESSGMKACSEGLAAAVSAVH